MSTVRDIITSIWLCCKLAIAAFFLGAQLFYVVGPLVLGAFATLLGLAIIARYLVWPVTRFAASRIYRLGVRAVRRLFGLPIIVITTPIRASRSPHFAHPVV